MGVLAAVIFLQLTQESQSQDEDNEADCFILFNALIKQMSCFMFEDETTEGSGMFDEDDAISPMDTMLHSM